MSHANEKSGDEPDMSGPLAGIVKACKNSIEDPEKNYTLAPILALALKAAPEGIMLMELDPRLMESTDGAKKLADAILEIKKDYEGSAEHFFFCIESWSTTQDIPDAYADMLNNKVVGIEDLPLRYRQEAVIIKYTHTPEFGEVRRWLGKIPFEREENSPPSNWGEISWQKNRPDISGIFADI